MNQQYLPLENRPESKSFVKTALAWTGSVTPRVMPRVFVVALWATAVYVATLFNPDIHLPITPFEYSGAVLALILVMRVNAGHDRWWEARKLWGGIVNQSRNLAITILSYNPHSSELAKKAAAWTAAWPFIMKASLRNSKDIDDAFGYLTREEISWMKERRHMPSQHGMKIAGFLNTLLGQGMSPFAFQRAETERSLLIDAIGACERIKSTRMPFVLAVKSRRFILFFLALLPFGLVEKTGILMPLVTALAAYPLFSLDEIGAELQNPFSAKNLSHLPLDTICNNIAGNIQDLILESDQLVSGQSSNQVFDLNPRPNAAVTQRPLPMNKLGLSQGKPT